MLSKRLNEISKFVPKNKSVYDIGCDHAFLDIFLTLNNNNKCFAIDISDKVIENAKKNIIKYNLESKIKTIVSDGVQNIKIKKNSIIVISGMGTHTIIDIVNNIDINLVDKLIIQSNNDLQILRKEITELGYIIEKEKIVYDNKKYYTIISFKKGEKKYTKKELEFGINTIKDVDYYNYLKYLIQKNNEINKKLTFKHLNKKINIIIQNKYIKKKLKN